MTNEVESQVEKVTTDRVKNPGRQEWGRKLGKLQREIKLRKLHESTLESTTEVKAQYLKWEYLMTVLGITIGIGALYYQKKSYEAQVTNKKIAPLIVETQSQFFDF
jgi:hypothetical protein